MAIEAASMRSTASAILQDAAIGRARMLWAFVMLANQSLAGRLGSIFAPESIPQAPAAQGVASVSESWSQALDAQAFACPQALKYDQWLQEARRGELDTTARYSALAHNGWADLVGGHLSDALRRGAGCFDQAFYVGANRFDLSYIEVRLTSGHRAMFLGPRRASCQRQHGQSVALQCCVDLCVVHCRLCRHLTAIFAPRLGHHATQVAYPSFEV